MEIGLVTEFDMLEVFTNDNYFWAEKTLQGRKYILKVTNPLYLYGFLDIPDKVKEGLETGFWIEETGSAMMKIKDVKKYAKHPAIHYHEEKGKREKSKRANKEREEEMVSLGTFAELVIQKLGEKDDKEVLYSKYWYKMDVMNAAILGESKHVFLEGLKQYMLVDCGIQETRQAVCMCHDEEILSALMKDECTSYYLEPEEALAYMNPILLPLVYECGGKVLEEDIYDRCLGEFARQYYLSNAPILQPKEKGASTSSVPKELKPIGCEEWRTYLNCVEDFIACMKYLKMQDFKREMPMFKQEIQYMLNLVQENIEKNTNPALYQEFVEIVNNR